MIKLDEIKGYSLGQRAAFEMLVCQLARRDAPTPKAAFRRIEGSGGDGGVEAYWLLRDGAEIGYQAKFCVRAGDIKWEQVNSSVLTAITQHPSLSKFIVAFPCDLTDRTGATKRGKTGWELWSNHVRKWDEEVARAKLKRKIEFVAWTAHEITDRLVRPENAGLRSYWFGGVELSRAWYGHQLEFAVPSLEDHYHPDIPV